MKIVEDSERGYYKGTFFIETFQDFQKYKNTNACIYRSKYELYMTKYSMADDDVFVKPAVKTVVQKEEALFDPYKDLNDKNKLLAEYKAKNVLYKKDPTMIPIQVGSSTAPDLLSATAQELVEKTFQ